MRHILAADLEYGDGVVIKGVPMTVTYLDKDVTGVSVYSMDNLGRPHFQAMGSEDLVSLPIENRD
jgi:riboflavin synthase alpha subunit